MKPQNRAMSWNVWVISETLTKCFGNVNHKVSHLAITNTFCLLRMIVQVVLHLQSFSITNKCKSLTHPPAIVVQLCMKMYSAPKYRHWTCYCLAWFSFSHFFSYVFYFPFHSVYPDFNVLRLFFFACGNHLSWLLLDKTVPWNPFPFSASFRNWLEFCCNRKTTQLRYWTIGSFRYFWPRTPEN